MKTLTDISIAVIKIQDLLLLSNDYSFLQSWGEKLLTKDKIKNVEKILPDSLLFQNSEDLETSVHSILLKTTNEMTILNYLENTLIFDNDKLGEVCQGNPNDDFEKDLEFEFGEISNISIVNNNINDDNENSVLSYIMFLDEDNFNNDEEYSKIQQQNDAFIELCSNNSFAEESDSKIILTQNSKTFMLFDFFKNHFLSTLKNNKKSIKILICFIISVYSIIATPIILIFPEKINHQDNQMIFLEIISSMILTIFFLQKWIKYIKAFKKLRVSNKISPNSLDLSKENNKNVMFLKMKSLNSIIFHFMLELLYLIPFSIILINSNLLNYYTFPFAILRIANVNPLLKGIVLMKQKNSFLGDIIHILLCYILFSHVSACVLIGMAFQEADYFETFLRRIPAPKYSFINIRRENFDIDFQTIYIHALYWVYSTISKIGAIDITIISKKEKTFAIFEMIFGSLLYLYIFGNVISIVEDLTPKVKNLLGKNKKMVMDLIKYLKFEDYAIKIEVYNIF